MPYNTFFVLINFSSFSLLLERHFLKRVHVNKIDLLHFICYVKISSAEVLDETLPLRFRDSFSLSVNQIGKKLLTRNGTLRKVFSSVMMYFFVKSVHVLSAQKEVSFFRDVLFRSKNNQITNPHYKHMFQKTVYMKCTTALEWVN